MALSQLLSVSLKSGLRSINRNGVRTVGNLASLKPNTNSRYNEELGILNKSTKSTTNSKLLVDGVNLYWKKFGNGPIVVMLMPGLVGSVKDNFLPVIKKMNLDKFTLIGWDPPGYGYSRPPDRDVFTEEFCLAKDARLAHSLMQELGYDRFSVVGWSNGGMTGALLAASFPESVEKVVMCNTPVVFNDRSTKIMEVMVNLDTWSYSQQKTLLRTYPKKYLEKMLRDWKTYVDREATTGGFTRYVSEQMEKINAPTLFIKSAEDSIVPMEDAENCGKLIQNFMIYKANKGGHDHLEFVDDFVAATESFLSA